MNAQFSMCYLLLGLNPLNDALTHPTQMSGKLYKICHFCSIQNFRWYTIIWNISLSGRYTSSLSELGFFPSQLNRLWKGPEKLMADTIAYLKFGFRFIGDGANPERVCGAAVADFHSSRISNPTELHLKIWMFKDVIGNSSLQMKEQEKDSTFKLFLMD